MFEYGWFVPIWAWGLVYPSEGEWCQEKHEKNSYLFLYTGIQMNYLLVIRQYNIEHHFPMIVLDLDSFALLGSQVGVEDEVDEEKFQA